MAGLAHVTVQKLVHGDTRVPESVISDCRRQFTNKFWTAFTHHLRISCQLCIVYHLQSEGQTKQLNLTLEQYTRTYIKHQQDDWVTWLPMAKSVYYNSVHASTVFTPFYVEQMVHSNVEEAVHKNLVNGFVPKVPDAKARAEQIVELPACIKNCSREAIEMQQKNANKRTEPRKFAVGNMVWPSGNNLRTKQLSMKLDQSVFRPFLVIERVCQETRYQSHN